MQQKSDKRAWMVIVIASVLVVGTAVAIIMTESSQKTTTGKIRVVAAENFWGSIASQIGGDRVEVVSFISDPSADPHLYESSATNAAAIAHAQLVVMNGLGYDDFMHQLMNASGHTMPKMVMASEVMDVSGSQANPHLWYDTSKVPLVAQAIERNYEQLDPQHASEYRANLKRFTESLQPITDTLAAIKQRYPGAAVAYTERVPGYLLQNAGLTVMASSGFAQAIEDGNDPSPSETTVLTDAINTHAVRAVLYNAQATSAVTQKIQDRAKQADVPVVGVTETMPPDAHTYQEWQLKQAQALLAALAHQGS